jgi:hypothetical protein
VRLAVPVIAALACGAATEFWDGRIVTGFEFECTDAELFRAAGLGPLVASLVERDREDTPSFWGNRAFRIDLDEDGNPEFFVPLLCGATGGCHWALVGGTPRRVIGELDGNAIFVHEPNETKSWPVLTAYGRAGAFAGSVTQYTWDRGGNGYKQTHSAPVEGIVWEAFLNAIGDPDCRIRRTIPAPGAVTP